MEAYIEKLKRFDTKNARMLAGKVYPSGTTLWEIHQSEARQRATISDRGVATGSDLSHTRPGLLLACMDSGDGKRSVRPVCY